MKAYVARLPVWAQVVVVVAIIIALVAALAAFMWLLFALNMSRPIAQMPWHYWLLIALFVVADVYILGLTRSTTSSIYEQGVVFPIVGIFILATTFPALIISLFNGSTTGQMLFNAVVWLPYGIMGARTLYQKWRKRQDHTALQ